VPTPKTRAAEQARLIASRDEVQVSGRPSALSAAAVERVVRGVLRGERRRARVSVTFLGPVRMRALNRQYLRHDHPTDVISFALAGRDGELHGDVYICRAVALRNAQEAGVSVRQELIRLVVHGTLHVLGYDHPDDDQRLRSPMWKRQERYVKRLG
jgi:probable rRNA maturation factor